jgi:hypothetical protein
LLVNFWWWCAESALLGPGLFGYESTEIGSNHNVPLCCDLGSSCDSVSNSRSDSDNDSHDA